MTGTTTTGGTRPTAFAADDLLVDSAERLFATTCTFDAVQAAEGDGWAAAIWGAVADAGFAWIGLPGDAGGSGGTLLDAAEVVRIAGACAAPIPLAETALLGGWLLARGGLELPDGPVTIVPDVAGDALVANGADDGSLILDGVAQRVPWAADSDRIAAIVTVDGREVVAAIDPADVVIEPATNLAGEPRPTVIVDAVRVPPERVAEIEAATGDSGDDDAGGSLGEELELRGALSRVLLMAGALVSMSELTVGYTGERQQFGRPVGRFQAVQQHLVWGAQDAAIVDMASRVAAGRASAVGPLGARFEIAAARTVADEAAGTATRLAHQAHGAMGMTQEYALHHLSRRLWSWRREWSGPGRWSGRVGSMAERVGADGLYPLISSQ
ncbi:MAG: acyl-CoA dehydrogenase [Actinomycetota bacterium]